MRQRPVAAPVSRVSHLAERTVQHGQARRESGGDHRGGSGLGRAMASVSSRRARRSSWPISTTPAARRRWTRSATPSDGLPAVDVTNEDDCGRAVAEAVPRWGKLDIMVANAGIGRRGPSPRSRRTPGRGAGGEPDRRLPLRQARLPRHARAGGGILATASVAGLEGTPGLGPYGASKAGVVQLMGTVALEGARYGIRANALCPVWTQTPMVDAFVSGRARTPEETRARLISGIPLGGSATVGRGQRGALSGVRRGQLHHRRGLPIDGGHLAGR